MVKEYTALTKRMLVVAAVIAISGQAHAADHGRMSKRHGMSCKQIFLAALGFSAVAQGAQYYYGIVGHTNGQRIGTNVPVCGDARMTRTTAEATVSSLLGQRVDIDYLKEVSPITYPVTLENGLEGIAYLCVPLHKLSRQNIDIQGSPVAQLPAPEMQ